MDARTDPQNVKAAERPRHWGKAGTMFGRPGEPAFEEQWREKCRLMEEEGVPFWKVGAIVERWWLTKKVPWTTWP